MTKIRAKSGREIRHRRVRAKVNGTTERPRLCVFRSLNHIYAQVVDDLKGHTLASASTRDGELKTQLDGKNKTAVAGLVGSLVAQRAQSQGVAQVVFDRGGYKYQGRVKALAEAARQAGLKF